MINIKGVNIINLPDGPIDPTLGKIMLRAYLTNVTGTPTAKFANMKYNKRAGMLMVKDDSDKGDYRIVYAYLHGGMTPTGGSYSEGVRYGDGCGNPVEYHHTFAINEGHGRDGSQPGYDNLETSWDEYIEMLQFGYSIANHSLSHGGYDKYKQIKNLELLVYDKVGLRTRTFVIPTADEGYAESAPYLGYKMVGSGFGANSPDDNNEPGNVNIRWGSRLDVNTITNQIINKFLFSRSYINDISSSDVNIGKEIVDYVLTQSVNGKNYMGHIFTHGVSEPGFSNFITYMQDHPNNNDEMWFPSMQEMTEYYETKLNVVKTEELEDNILDIELDLSDLPKEGLWRDMSLILEGAEIAALSVTGADNYTFNPTTGLINIFKKNPSVKDPATDPVPPQIINVERNNNQLILTYDKPITQSVFASQYGNAYTVSGNTINSITGAGTVWQINCSSIILSGQTLDYRMQRGNAMDLDGLKVCSYIGYPIP